MRDLTISNCRVSSIRATTNRLNNKVSGTVVVILCSASIITVCQAAFNSQHVTLDAPFAYNFLSALHGNSTSYPNANATTNVSIDPAYNVTFSEATCLAHDGAGGLYVAGNLEVEHRPDDPVLPKTGVMTDAVGDTFFRIDIFVTRILSDGSLAWIKRMGTFGDDKATDVVVDEQGYVYVTAQLSHSLADGTRGDVVFKLRPSDGERVWAKSYGTRSGREQLISLAIVPKAQRNSKDQINATNTNAENSTLLVVSATAGSGSTLLPGGGAVLLLVNGSDGELITHFNIPLIERSRGITVSALTLRRERVVVSEDNRMIRRQDRQSSTGDQDSQADDQDNQPDQGQGNGNGTSTDEDEVGYVEGEDVMVNGCGFINYGVRLNAALFSFRLTLSNQTDSDSDQEVMSFEEEARHVVEYRQNEYFSGAAMTNNGQSVYCSGTKTISSYEERDGRVIRFNSSQDLTRGWVSPIGSKRFLTLKEAQHDSGTMNEEGLTISTDEHGNLFVLFRSTSQLAIFNDPDIHLPSRRDGGRLLNNESRLVEMSHQSTSENNNTEGLDDNNNNNNTIIVQQENDTIVHDRPAVVVIAPNGSVIDAIQARVTEPLNVNAMVRIGAVVFVAGKSAHSQAVVTAAMFPNSTSQRHAEEFVPPEVVKDEKTEPPQDDQTNQAIEEEDDKRGDMVWIIITGTVGGVLFATLVVSIACFITRGAVRKARGIEEV